MRRTPRVSTPLLPRSTLAFLLIFLGCGAPDATTEVGSETASSVAVEIMDAEGRTVRLGAPVRRVVSLVPSVTETILALGGADALVARTDFDPQPNLQSLPTVGGGLGPDLETLAAVEPDLVVRFGGDSDVATVRRLDDLGIPHVAVRPDRLEDVWTIVEHVGTLLGRTSQADSLATQLRLGIDAVRTAVAGKAPVRAAYLMGGSPPWTAGAGTYIDELIGLAGGTNVFADVEGLFGALSPELVATRPIDVVLLSDGATVDPRLLEGRTVRSLSGLVELPGPRIVEAAREVARALHPDLTLR